MKIEASTRSLALRSILRRRHRAWGMSATDLQRAWYQTGLRHADLDRTLREMSQEGKVEIRNSTWGARIYLTRDEPEAEPTVQVVARDGLDWLRLVRLKLRRRVARPSTSLKRRRAADRA